MHKERFFKDSKIPFAECRFTQGSSVSFKPHLHHSFCIGGIEEGEVVFQVAGDELLLQPGGIALVNPDTIHSCNPESSTKRSFYMLYLDVDWCLKIQQSLWQNTTFIPVDSFLVNDATLFGFYLETMTFLMGDYYLLEKEQNLVYLAESIFARCCNPTVPTVASSGYVNDLKEWLVSNLENDQTLESYAQQKNINPYTLLRHFRTQCGVTPHSFRMNCRIEKARELLQQGCEIGSVAQICGFFDQSHLHRHFKAITSITPGEYQRNFKKG